MKKTLAVLLSLIMVLALIPATFAEDAEYTLVIKGGETKDNLETVDGVECLKVDVELTGTVADELLFGITFDINYDAAQLTLKEYDTSGVDAAAVNDKTAGTVRYSAASAQGIALGNSTLILTLYFELAEDLEEGTEIAFTLADGATVDAVSWEKPVFKDIAADFKPFTFAAPDPLIPLDGEVVINENEVEWRGQTPYLVWSESKKAYTPGFKVYDKDTGKEIDPSNYDYEYKENTLPGTGYIFVYFKGAYTGECQTFFKIYLPAAESITVENVDNGIKVKWSAVKGAAGYVIYRRAWSSTTNGWTDFARWNNTTSTTYIDGADANDKVYAGTRYQYGVKAYFARRLDPVAGIEIGGNVNEDSGNFNLGLVSPLKTTVRITSRKLTSVTGGSKQMTVKWEGSKNFTGYEIRYATDSAFTKNVKTVKITKAATTQTTIKSLKAGTYYVQVRSYHDFQGMTYYGAWSNTLNCKVK